MINSWIPVVAGALRGEDDRFLMHKRPLEKHHGGLWEFPGGKVELTENPRDAVIRELREELGISVLAQDCIAAGFAQEDEAIREKPIVILLYTIAKWEGVPTALEGGSVGWFTPQEIDSLAKPPLDIALARQLFKNL
ncbi:MAG: (deoxy)nucleoside triphosphate pyrophosphohydrolase [Pseudomonadota bacterium]